MKISVKLYSVLVKYMPEDAGNYPVQDGISLDQLMRDLGIPQEKDRGLIFFINGEVVKDRTRKLSEGDEVKVFLVLGGG